METNDLRIGNYVDCNKKRHNEKSIKVESMTFDKINVEFREYNLSDLIPIHLTDKVLLNAGFKKREYDICDKWYIGENPVTHDWLFDITWIHGHPNPFYRNGFHEIKYLHQLQNWFFLLSGGEELVFSTEP